MYFSSTQFSFMGISNSESSLPKQDQKETKSHIPSSPTSESSIGPQNPPSIHQNQQVNRTEESSSPVFLEIESQNTPSNHQNEEINLTEESISPVLSETEPEVADDNDGFRTPTSLDHKIPVTKQCPPAPRKKREKHFSSRKRKLETPRSGRNLQLDLTDEIESLFPPSVKENLGRRIKKARREDD
ncbi:hypothetical protein LguiB_015648 [Lonicera macranthoides]